MSANRSRPSRKQVTRDRGKDGMRSLTAILDSLMQRLSNLEDAADHDGTLLMRELAGHLATAKEMASTGNRNAVEACVSLAPSVYRCCQNTGDDLLLRELHNLIMCEALSLNPFRFATSLVNSLQGDANPPRNNSFLSEVMIMDVQESPHLAPRSQEHLDDNEAADAAYGDVSANSLLVHYQRTGSDRFLKAALGQQREALRMQPPGHSDRGKTCLNLAQCLWDQYNSTGHVSLLIEAIDFGQEALDLHPHGHPHRAETCIHLAIPLKRRHLITGDNQLLLKAISLEREAKSICAAGHPVYAQTCANLAVSLQTRFKTTGEAGLLAESISLSKEALSLRPPGDPAHVLSCVNVASTLYLDYARTGDDHLLDEIIDFERQALKSCPEGHSYRWACCGNLASSLKTWHTMSGDDQLIVEAIKLAREARHLQSGGQPNEAGTCRTLAIVLKARYRSSHDTHLLEEAINLEKTALLLCPPGHSDRAKSCANLAASLFLLSTDDDNGKNLDEAIKLQNEVLSLRSSIHPDHVKSLNNLAQYLSKLFEVTGNQEYLTSAIDRQREALSLCPMEHLERFTCCLGLIHYLWRSYENSRDDAILEEIHNHCKAAPSVHPSQHWKITAMLARLHLQSGTTHISVSAAVQYLHESLLYHPDNVSSAALSITEALDDLWLVSDDDTNIEQRVAVVPVYQQLIRLLPFSNHPMLSTQQQLEVLREHKVNQLGSDAFVNAILADSLPLGLEDLEVMQGLVLSQRLHIRDPQYEGLPPQIWAQLKDKLKALSHFATVLGDTASDSITLSGLSPGLTLRDMHHNYATQVYAMIRDIRENHGIDRFMLGENYANLCSVASSHPVVLLVSARRRYYAVLFTTQKVVVLQLDWNEQEYVDIFATDSSSVRLVDSDKPLEILSMPVPPIRAHKAKNKSAHVVQTVQTRRMHYIWYKIARPILDKLGIQLPAAGQVRPRLHWCLTGVFSELPIHAAGIYDGPVTSHIGCADYVVSSYTPTLTCLLRAQKAVVPMSKDSSTIALVAEKRAKDKQLPLIPQVDKEVADIANVSAQYSVSIVHQTSGPSTVADTSLAIEGASLVHLACHGIQDTKTATESGFCLGDGRLTISTLMGLNLRNAFLAYLSACETAKGDANQPDQTMHLAAAMLFAGFKSVIAAMWSISDVDGPRVAKWFYEELFNREVIDADAVACALDFAIGKLRKEGVPFEQWASFIHMGA